MAIATSTSFYSSSIVGTPQVGGPDIDVHARDTSPRFAVGFGFTRGDGNKFRYVQYGAAVAAGALVGCNNTNNNVSSEDGIVVAPATAQAIASEVIRPGAAGSRYVEITLATAAADQFAGGYLVITKDSGAGYTYFIRGNTATNSPTSGNIRMELAEDIVVALDNTSDIAIAASHYADLDEAAACGTCCSVAGVSMRAATANNYGWVCTGGPVGVLSSDVGAAGDQVLLTNGTTAGEVRTLPDDTTLATATNWELLLANSPLIGIRIVPAGAAGQLSIVDMKLE